MAASGGGVSGCQITPGSLQATNEKLAVVITMETISIICSTRLMPFRLHAQ